MAVGLLIFPIIESIIEASVGIIIFLSIWLLFGVLIIVNECIEISKKEKTISRAINILVDSNIKLLEENAKLKSVCDSDILDS